ncbi:MAG: hypothetical protein UZ17_ACD001002621 [Acidobacteria bacterium OLB17]|nr:MAG: hypothetical protein UZ17_ACD001002621 [Acidobacteria bacterium OLB17]MCZ2390847.1 hypothetical protein [Acidobacteriota bacterium]
MRHCLLFVLTFIFAAGAFAQGTIVVHDPMLPAKDGEAKPPRSIEKIYETKILPPVRKKLVSDSCSDSPTFTGAVNGSFTKAGARQTAVFYQFCETGNGLGMVGLAIIENGRLVSSFVQDSGWAFDIGRVADVNRNGLDEIALEFGGGMHQGEGGTGVSIYEFKDGKPVELGWYQSSKFTETETTAAWRLTAKPGKRPIFYRQKYVMNRAGKYRRSGANKAFKLEELEGGNEFEEVK